MKPFNRFTAYKLLLFGACAIVSAVCRYYTPEGSFVLEALFVFSAISLIAAGLRTALQFFRKATEF